MITNLLYIQIDHLDESDGGAIFDKKLKSVIHDSGIEVVSLYVKRADSFSIPFWSYRIDKTVLREIQRIKKDFDQILVSHECLGDYAVRVKADHFIFHNLFSTFYFKENFLLNSYYRFYSRIFERKILNYCKNVYVLSNREHKYLQNNIGYKAERIVPAGTTKYSDIFDNKKIIISGTNNWLPKRLSKMPSYIETELIKSGFYIERDYASNSAGISIITDKFNVGFKLKISQAAQRGDVIISMVDLSMELETFNYPLENYFHLTNWKELLDVVKNINRLEIKTLKKDWNEALKSLKF